MFFLYFIGIDISKYKHDCFITTETGEVIVENFSFQNTNEGLNQLLDLLKSLDYLMNDNNENYKETHDEIYLDVNNRLEKFRGSKN